MYVNIPTHTYNIQIEFKLSILIKLDRCFYNTLNISYILFCKLSKKTVFVTFHNLLLFFWSVSDKLKP